MSVDDWKLPTDNPDRFSRMICLDGLRYLCDVRAAIAGVEEWCKQHGYETTLINPGDSFIYEGQEYSNERRNKRLLEFRKKYLKDSRPEGTT